MSPESWREFAEDAGIAAVVSLVGTRVVLAVARRRGILDVPNERSSHTTATPRLGGLGIVLGISGFAGLKFHPDFLARLFAEFKRAAPRQDRQVEENKDFCEKMPIHLS